MADILGTPDADLLDGTSGDDTIHGGDGDDTITAGLGIDQVFGDAGDDTLVIASPNEIGAGEHYDGGSGTDTFRVDYESGWPDGWQIDLTGITFSGVERFVSPYFQNRVNGAQLAGFNYIEGNLELAGGGSLSLSGKELVGQLHLSSSFTTLDLAGVVNSTFTRVYVGTGGADINGSSFDDLVEGNTGNDILRGNDGNDDLRGGGGTDQLFGGDGDDLFYFHGTDGTGATVDGGAGFDTLTFQLGTSDFSLSALTFAAIEKLSVSISFDNQAALLVTAAQINSMNQIEGGRLRIVGGGPVSLSGVVLLGNQSFELGAGITDIDVSGIGAGSQYYVFLGNGLANAMTGSPFDDSLLGGGGNDTINGADGNDLLTGEAGDDTILGGDGNDSLTGNAGIDQLHGGNGDDSLEVGSLASDATAGEIYDGGAGWDRLSVGSFIQEGLHYFDISGATLQGIEHLVSGPNLQPGLARVATRVGTAQIQAVNRLSGWFILNDSAPVNLAGIELVNVEIALSDAGQTLDATSAISLSPLVIGGGTGADTITAGSGNHWLYGGYGDDTLRGSSSGGYLYGGPGNDRVIVKTGGLAAGDEGYDTLVIQGPVSFAGPFAVTGFEAIEFTSGTSLTLTGLQVYNGFALATAVTGTGSLTINMTAGQFLGTKFWTVASGIAVTINGTSGTDIMKLGNNAQSVFGGDGSDQIKGGSGVDTIDGGAGVDKIMGMGGADVLTGGAGNDVFRYLAPSDSGLGAAADRITDFAIGQDRINLANIDTNAGLAGMQGFAFAGTAAFAGGGLAQVRYQDSGADILVQADVNGDGAADMEIKLAGLAGQSLTAASFVLGTPPAMEPPSIPANVSAAQPPTAANETAEAQAAVQFGDSPRGITGSYTVVNTAGIAQATIDLLTGLADEALRLWGTVLAGTANISVELTIAEVSNNRGNGTWGTGFSAGTSGGYSVAIGAPAWELAFGVNSGGSTDIKINLDPDYIANELFLDPTPGTRDDIPANRTDGLSVFIHEIGHALGFIGYYDEANNTFFSNTKTTYDLRLLVSNGNVSFDGPNVQAVYGGAVPLTDNNYAHYGNSFAFPWSSGDPLTGLMNGVVYYRGYAYTIQDIDLAFLADTGLGTIRDDILNVPNLTRMRGGPGNDTITGSTVNNFLWGDEGNDTIYGGGGNDTIDGGSGANLLFGEAGNDRLLVSASGTSVDGGADSDTLSISGTVASLAGLTGIETVELAAGSSLTLTSALVSAGLPSTAILTGSGSMTINMSAGVSLLTKVYNFTGFTGQFTVNGTSGTDIIKLGNVVQTVNLGDGLDTVQGGSLVDTINGNGGVDKIAGNGGADVLTGGTGNDVFKYRSASDSGLGAAADRITDFTIGQDRINFVRIDADTATAGDQAFAYVGTAAFASSGTGQLRYLTSGSDLIVQADVNGDGTADMEIVLQGLAGQTLSATDFVL